MRVARQTLREVRGMRGEMRSDRDVFLTGMGEILRELRDGMADVSHAIKQSNRRAEIVFERVVKRLDVLDEQSRKQQTVLRDLVEGSRAQRGALLRVLDEMERRRPGDDWPPV